ncbi:DUF2169 domain-containing protein [Sorangium sp. So ce513]|uniref:DUF2169 family type VI secretion system accessory protein n=1 Tax=Sorangium sp. So ce513 TaxID=3133315 RepID=UPI003F60FD55
MQGAERLTVIVKATFVLVHERCAEIAPADDLVRADQPRDRWGTLDEACETAPYLPSAGVLVRGHASAPAGETATSLSVRVALFRDDRWLLNKVLHVFGDYTRAAPSPRPFSRMPIVYERAYGGPHVDANPAGVGADQVLPSIVDPSDPTRPAGFGPIARHWAPRRHLLARDHALDRPVPELGAGFDFRYFHAAPPDQQIEFLRGDEWIVLEGLHPQYPLLRSSLPSARGLARVHRAGASGEDHGQPIDLVADTLTIDADRLVCSVIWRGNIALLPGDTPARMRVVAGVELPGRPLVWPAPLAGPPSSRVVPGAPGPAEEVPASARRPVIEDEVTAETHIATLVAGVAPPFALAEPASGPPVRRGTIPGAPWSTRSRATPPRTVSHLTPETPPRAVSHFTPEMEAALGEVGGMLAPWIEAHPTETAEDPERAPSSPVLPFVAAAPPPPREPPQGSVPFALPFARPGNDPSLRSDDLPAPPPPSTEALAGQSPATLPPPSPASPGEVAAAPAPYRDVVPAPAPYREVPAVPAPVSAAPASSAVPAPASTQAAVPAPASNRAAAPAPASPRAAVPAPASNRAAAPAPASPRAAASAPASTRAAVPAPASTRATPVAPLAAPAEPEARGLRAALLARLKNGQPLHDLELAGVELEGIDFSGASLERMNLAGSTLTRCNFASARLAGVNMSSADLTDASFHAADLTRADLSHATLDRAQLSEARLDRADLAFARGSSARFDGASLEGADLRQARLTESVFDRASLADVNGSKADVSRSSFVSANLAGAILRSAKLKEATLACANIDGADLRDADLAGANVYGVKLANAKSNGAILRALVEIPPPDDGIHGSSGG